MAMNEDKDLAGRDLEEATRDALLRELKKTVEARGPFPGTALREYAQAYALLVAPKARSSD